MIEQNAFTIIFGVFVLFTCRDVFFGHAGQDAEPHHGKPPGEHLGHHHPGSLDDIPHMSAMPGIATVKIQYCQSCGYRQAFDTLSKLLQNNYPEIKIEGEVHKPNFLRSSIVNLLFLAKIAILGMIYMEFNPFTYFNFETPRYWTFMLSSKISSTLMILFAANTIEGNLMATGAFEIYYNDLPIWSKLETGRLPSVPEMIQAIQSQRAFVSKRVVGEFVPT